MASPGAQPSAAVLRLHNTSVAGIRPHGVVSLRPSRLAASAVFALQGLSLPLLTPQVVNIDGWSTLMHRFEDVRTALLGVAPCCSLQCISFQRMPSGPA